MKLHARYEQSFGISLQIIVIPHYSCHSEAINNCGKVGTCQLLVEILLLITNNEFQHQQGSNHYCNL